MTTQRFDSWREQQYQDADEDTWREHWCECCGDNLATHIQTGHDSTPTDRGEIKEYVERYVCDECDPGKGTL